MFCCENKEEGVWANEKKKSKKGFGGGKKKKKKVIERRRRRVRNAQLSRISGG